MDLANHMGYSRPSISHAVSALKEGGFLEMGRDGSLTLTEQGKKVAERIYERHRFFMEYLIAVGVEPKLAEEDACRMEHVISDESFEKLKRAAEERHGKFGKKEEES